MTEPQYTVGTDDVGRWCVVDTLTGNYRLPAHRYGTREEAQERADRYNAIKAGKL